MLFICHRLWAAIFSHIAAAERIGTRGRTEYSRSRVSLHSWLKFRLKNFIQECVLMDQELQAGLDHLDGQIKAFISRHENQNNEIQNRRTAYSTSSRKVSRRSSPLKT